MAIVSWLCDVTSPGVSYDGTPWSWAKWLICQMLIRRSRRRRGAAFIALHRRMMTPMARRCGSKNIDWVHERPTAAGAWRLAAATWQCHRRDTSSAPRSPSTVTVQSNCIRPPRRTLSNATAGQQRWRRNFAGVDSRAYSVTSALCISSCFHSM